jgi:hypothetical protein
MKIFIFESIYKLTDSYHEGGGLVIVAKDEDHAKQLITSDPEIQPTEDEWKSAVVLELANEEDPRFWTMPNAGCC